MSQVVIKDGKITLKNVRLSFPSLFNKGEFDGKASDKFEATFLMSMVDEKGKALIDAEIERVKELAKKKVPASKYFIKDGNEIFEEKEYDGYADHWAIKAGNKKRPTVIDRDKSPLTDEDGKVYAGCYVNAIITLWVQDNQYGKRVNANLLGVQFVKDGEPFGDAVVADANEFDELDDEDDL